MTRRLVKRASSTQEKRAVCLIKRLSGRALFGSLLYIVLNEYPTKHTHKRGKNDASFITTLTSPGCIMCQIFSRNFLHLLVDVYEKFICIRYILLLLTV